MTIVVTGGAGFLGARLIAALLKDGADRIVELVHLEEQLVEYALECGKPLLAGHLR